MKPNRNPVSYAVALLGALILVPASLLLAAPAPEANPPPASARGDEVVKLEAFSVTGTNIKRIETENALPITILSTSDIEIRDAAQPSDLLMALPQVTGLPGNETAT